MKLKIIFSALLLFFTITIRSQEKTSSVLDQAFTEAVKSNKNVFIMFHASWCGWCKKMDKNMKNDTCKDYFNKNFVITHLTVMETKEKKHLENPGAMEFMKKYKGGNSGIPFWLIFNKDRQLLADSRDSKGNNLGCPATKKEVTEFINKLSKAGSLTNKEKKNIKKIFILKK